MNSSKHAKTFNDYNITPITTVLQETSDKLLGLLNHIEKKTGVNDFKGVKLYIMPHGALAPAKAMYDQGSRTVVVDPDGTSFVHELGHVVDRNILSRDGQPWSEKNRDYRKTFGFRKRKAPGHVRYINEDLGIESQYYTPKQNYDEAYYTKEYSRSHPKEHFASTWNKLLGEKDGSRHEVSDTDVRKFKRLVIASRRLKRALAKSFYWNVY